MSENSPAVELPPIRAHAWRRSAAGQGQALREALGIREGDEVVFRVEGGRAVLARRPDFLALAGSVEVPAAKPNAAWDEVIRRTRAARVADRR